MRDKTVYFFAIALAALGWLILLSGVAAMQQKCGKAGYTTAGDAGYLGRVGCDVLFGYAWWVVFFEAAVLAFCCVAHAGQDEVAPAWKMSLVGLLAVTTVLLMDTANTFSLFRYYDSVLHTSQPRAVMAGAIMASMANLVLMVVAGRESQGVIFTNMEAPRKVSSVQMVQAPGGVAEQP